MRAHDGYSGRLFVEGRGEYRALLGAESYSALVVPCAGRGGQSAGAGRSSWNYLSRYLFSHSCSRLRGVGLRQSQGVSWAQGWASRGFLTSAVRDVGGTVRVDSAYRWGGKVTSRLHNTHVCFNLFCLHGLSKLFSTTLRTNIMFLKSQKQCDCVATCDWQAWVDIVWVCGCVLWGDWGWEGHNATLSISRREIPLSVFFLLFNGQNQKNFISVTRFEGYPWVSVTYFENDKSISRTKFIWQNLMFHGCECCLVLCESGFELKLLWQKGAN